GRSFSWSAPLRPLTDHTIDRRGHAPLCDKVRLSRRSLAARVAFRRRLLSPRRRAEAGGRRTHRRSRVCAAAGADGYGGTAAFRIAWRGGGGAMGAEEVPARRSRGA